MPPALSSLPDRLRGGDATALLELAHATHRRALAVARASGWSDDPETLLLDAYVALWLRRADVPDGAAAAEGWALAEVLAYGARDAARRESRRAGWRAACRAAWAAGAAIAGRVLARALARAVAHLAVPPLRRPAS